jgi:2-dehydropantoate 2-reductase
VTQDPWPRTAVLGAGAVGCYFGGMLARAGAPVTLIGRPRHVETITRDGLCLETLHFRQQVPLAATTDVAAARAAAVVLFCVKTLDTETAAQELAPHLAADAVVVSLQNGVDNAERIRTATGIDAVPAVVYVAAEMVAPGHVKHNGRGDLLLGGARPRRELEDLAALFVRAGVPCLVSDNIAADLWTKLIINCAYNAISALARSKYGRIVSYPPTRAVMRQVTEEALAVARADGVRFPACDMVEAVFRLGHAMSGATSSTAQDLARGKPTEIDSLNGYVVRRGAALGVPAPVNQTLHALVKLLEGEQA